MRSDLRSINHESFPPSIVVLVAAAAASAAASAHVTLPPGGATAGDSYAAAFRVGHACKGAKQHHRHHRPYPQGLSVQKAEPRAGWTLVDVARQRPWRADSAAIRPARSRARRVRRSRQAAATPGTLWFKVLQTCDVGSADWAEVPAAATDKPAFPAARLDVLAPGVAAVEVRDAWVRFAVQGQSGTGAFMTLPRRRARG